MSLQITGKVFLVGEVQQISDKFSKRDLVILDDSNAEYPEYISVEATQDKVSLFDGLSEGQEVTVSINIRGRKWVDKEGKDRYFNSIVAWRVQKGSNQGTPPLATINSSQGNINPDDLPF